MTRRNFLVLAGIAVVVAALLGLILRSTPTSSTQPEPTPSSPTLSGPAASTPAASPSPAAANDASAGDQPYSKTDAARKAWEPAVIGFGRTFTDTQPGTTWPQRLQPYVTTDLQRQLATIDPANVPTGRYVGYQVLEYDDDQLAAQIDYHNGWSLAVYVIFDGDHWRIYQYDRYEQ